MEIPAWFFFSFWSLISITFLHLAFNALDRTGLSSSVSPAALCFFMHSLAISTCSSSSYALIFRLQLKVAVDIRYYWVVFAILAAVCHITALDEIILFGPVLFSVIKNYGSSGRRLRFLPDLNIFVCKYCPILIVIFLSSAFFPWYFPISTFTNFLLIFIYYWPSRLTGKQITGMGTHMALESSMFFVSSETTRFFPILVLFVSFLISAYCAALSSFEPFTNFSWDDPLLGDSGFNQLLPLAAKVKDIFLILKEKQEGEILGIAVGLGGSVLFQNYFRLTTFHHVVTFLYVGVTWLANLALLGVSGDFGVFNFILGNVLVGSTVSEFGLGRTTWLAYGASLLLFGLRLKLDSVTTGLDREGGTSFFGLKLKGRRRTQVPDINSII